MAAVFGIWLRHFHHNASIMALSRSITSAIVLAGAFAAGAWAQKTGVLAPFHTTYLRLAAPVALNAGSDAGRLPAGTALYRDATFAEGHVRYIVYVNVKGPLPAQHVHTDTRNLIDPLWSTMPD